MNNKSVAKCPHCGRFLKRVGMSGHGYNPTMNFYFVCSHCKIEPYGWDACFTINDVVLI